MSTESLIDELRSISEKATTPLSEDVLQNIYLVLNRLDRIGNVLTLHSFLQPLLNLPARLYLTSQASETNGVKLLIDAEQTYFQRAIDFLTLIMMKVLYSTIGLNPGKSI